MKIRLTFLAALFLIFILVTGYTAGKQERPLHIESLIIQFDKTNATFTINYDFDQISKMYLILFGAKSIEPKIRSIFSNFDFEIIKMDEKETILNVKNISRLDKGYYLHDSNKFGETIDTVYIYSSDSSHRSEYYNINATPYYFYRS